MPRLVSIRSKILTGRTGPRISYSMAPSSNSVDEGSNITINVTTTNVDNGTELFWSVSRANDFSSSTGSVIINNNAASFVLSALADQTTEGAENNTVFLRKDSNSGTIVATTTFTINDTSETPPLQGTWSAGGNMSQVRNFVTGAGSSQNSAIVFHGATTSFVYLTSTETYNGTAWSAGPSTNTLRRASAGIGTATAAISAGGLISGSSTTNSTEEYDGTTWSTGPNLPEARYGGQGFGLRSSSVVQGGWVGPAVRTSSVTYNGTTWSNSANASVARSQGAGAGRTASGLVSTGRDFTTNGAGPRTATTEEYNGTTWSAGGNTSAMRENIAATISSSSTATALMAGGQPDPQNRTEVYEANSTWTTTGNLIQGRDNLGVVGDRTSALAFGGRFFTFQVSLLSSTEEFTGS